MTDQTPSHPTTFYFVSQYISVKIVLVRRTGHHKTEMNSLEALLLALRVIHLPLHNHVLVYLQHYECNIKSFFLFFQVPVKDIDCLTGKDHSDFQGSKSSSFSTQSGNSFCKRSRFLASQASIRSCLDPQLHKF